MIDPAQLKKIASMELRARLVVEGFVSGLHRSRHQGYNVEFAEHRQYSYGDEPRYIDWRVWGRTDKYYVRQFEEETNLRCCIVLDASASMGFTSGPLSKLAYSQYLAAALIYLMFRQSDSVGLAVFQQELMEYIPPRLGRGHVNFLYEQLERIVPDNRTHLAGALDQLAGKLKKRNLIIVISDLWDEPEEVMMALKQFHHRRHEVIVFHVLDSQEYDFNYRGPLILVDMEDGRRITTQAQVLQHSYRKAVKDLCAVYRDGCLRHYIDYFPVKTIVPFDQALLTYLAKRQKMQH